MPVYDPSIYYSYQFVEVNGPSGWGQLCAESLTLNASNVICRETEEMFALRMTNQLQRPGYDGVRYRGTPYCKGDEAKLDDCTYYFYKVNFCLDGDAVMDCSEGKQHQGIMYTSCHA